MTYDAVNLLADAIRRADSVDPAQIRNALAHTSGFQGITGTITFDPNGDPVKSAVILKFQDGDAVYYQTIEP